MGRGMGQGGITMTQRTYTPEYRAKLVLRFCREKDLNTIAAENSLSPNMLRNWKAGVLENADRAFEGNCQEKEADSKVSQDKSVKTELLRDNCAVCTPK